MQQRHSEVGRFLSVDPLAADYAAWSTYNYVMGNPVYFIDPSGMGAEKTDDFIFLDDDNNEIYRIEQEGAHKYYKGIDEVDSPVEITFRAGVNQDVVSTTRLVFS
jgi:uncharacterized protein RhaS with RHS repeats